MGSDRRVHGDAPRQQKPPCATDKPSTRRTSTRLRVATAVSSSPFACMTLSIRVESHASSAMIDRSGLHDRDGWCCSLQPCCPRRVQTVHRNWSVRRMDGREREDCHRSAIGASILQALALNRSDVVLLQEQASRVGGRSATSHSQRTRRSLARLRASIHDRAVAEAPHASCCKRSKRTQEQQHSRPTGTFSLSH